MAEQKKKPSAQRAVKTVSRSGSSKNISKPATAKSGTSKPKSKQSNVVKFQTETRNDSYKKPSDDSSLYDEILMIALIILSVIVMLSLFTSVMGILGELINKFFKGMMGISSFILPVLVSVFSVWWLFSRKRRFARAKAVGIALFIVSFAALFQLITQTGGSFNDIGFFARIGKFYSEGNSVNGGIIGGITAYYLSKFLGWGSYIVIIALIIVSIMLSTGKSLVTGVSSVVGYANDKKRMREAAIKAEAENIRLREEKRARKRELEEAKFEQRINNTKPKYKKGNFNITINGDEGLDNTLPSLDAVMFTKREEPEPEQKEEIYDFCSEVPDDDEEDGFYAGDKFIEVLGAVREEDNSIECEPIVFGVPESKLNQEKETPKAVENSNKNAESAEMKEHNINIHLKTDDENILDSVVTKTEEEVSQDDDSQNGIIIEEYNGKDNNSDSENTKPEEVINEEPDENNSLGYELSGDEKAVEAQGMNALDTDMTQTNELIENSSVRKEENPNADISAENEEEIIEKEVESKPAEPVKKEYVFPPFDLLGKEPEYTGGETKEEMLENAKKLEDTLHSFGVSAKVVQINKGPTVTRYELTPSQGVKVSKIVNLSDDIALNLAATGIRIEAPIPGKAAVGIEVPNKTVQSVYMRTVLESDAFKNAESKLTFVLGKDIAGNCVVTDIAKMPHLLIAGATGSGKSVCINTIITSIIYKAKPEEVKLLLVDPKVVELSIYNGIPHLLIPVVTDPKKASGALNWAVKEMLARYNTFAESHVRDIKGYNAMKKEKGETDLMPQIVIIIDELADLMMAAPNEVEESICRLAQLARAAGMHLIIATQRPSVDIITGVIKANIPSRIAFAVSSGIDSRTILDTVGAEKLLGKGDMLFYPTGKIKPIRVQGAFVTDKEVENIVDFVKDGGETVYDNDVIEKITSTVSASSADNADDRDEFFDKAVELVISREKASVSMLQRQFRIGYNRAARIVEDMEAMGVVGPEEGSKPRKVLLNSMEEYRNMINPSEEQD